MSKIKEIKSIIEKGDVKFTVKGITEFQRGGEDNEYGDFPKLFRISEKSDAIFEDSSLFGRGMNITKLGPTCITLYDYNMLGKKTTGKINYKDITIL
tara:strand:- start:242 stop:532 length:291 start_codon:yes stop_codon:yes gene_type:complete